MNDATMPAPLPRGPAPETQGVPSSAVLAFVDAAERAGLELHGLMLLRHGNVVAEGWWAPYAPARPHMLYSLSKSFAATAAGLAIAENRFSLDDVALDFFPNDAPAAVSPNLAALRVRHLLSMATGHTQDTTRALRDAPDGDWVRAFFAQPVEKEPGTHFLYNSGATYLVSAIVHKTTGGRVLDYLRPRLFDPLGIQDPTWETCPRGVDVGGWGLSITTEDIARFGQLYLQKGMWRGERLLPEAWVGDATTAQVSNGDPAQPSDWSRGYGYQFWRCRHDAYRGDGAFGQFCVVLPDQDAVVAITAGVGDMQAELNLVWEHLLPAMGDAPLPDNPAAHARLRERLAGLALPGPQKTDASPIAARVSGKTYRFAAENEQKIETVACAFGNDEAVVTVRDASGTHRVVCGYGAWREGTTTFLRRSIWPAVPPEESVQVAARGAWIDENTFVARLCFYETPFAPTLTCRFADGGDRLLLDLRGSAGFGPGERPTLEGCADA